MNLPFAESGIIHIWVPRSRKIFIDTGRPHRPPKISSSAAKSERVQSLNQCGLARHNDSQSRLLPLQSARLLRLTNYRLSTFRVSVPACNRLRIFSSSAPLWKRAAKLAGLLFSLHAAIGHRPSRNETASQAASARNYDSSRCVSVNAHPLFALVSLSGKRRPPILDSCFSLNCSNFVFQSFRLVDCLKNFVKNL